MKNIFLILILLPFLSFTQNVGCNYEQSNQFDFWVGNWNVYDTLGNIVGENRIKKQYENCLIQENWVSSGANKGTSYNYFNPKDSLWNQLWIDNQGSILNLKGKFEEDKMVLSSDLISGNKIPYYYNQISWSKKEDGSVHQVWKILNENHEVIQLAFYGIYRKK